MALKRIFLRCLSVTLVAAAVAISALLFLAMQKQESTLEIRAAAQGAVIPDGFSVWHHLDANGIRFKSITPQKDTLLIKFDSSDQSAAAREVLYRTLPRGFIIAQQDEDAPVPGWLNRLRHDFRQLG
ncbi:EnvZ/OmpR regulon moderator MzrA [Franconibacter pulveris]|uniref:EnvZ/OmpR regulon moderator MzrA n=1 Tax=Franconibacter pulveris TaxID=435910 RepID=UPI0004971FAA|nr:EnvZ/OmpR regulon moderator MzrA [Franconibacter pulveris]